MIPVIYFGFIFDQSSPLKKGLFSSLLTSLNAKVACKAISFTSLGPKRTSDHRKILFLCFVSSGPCKGMFSKIQRYYSHHDVVLQPSFSSLQFVIYLSGPKTEASFSLIEGVAAFREPRCSQNVQSSAKMAPRQLAPLSRT